MKSFEPRAPVNSDTLLLVTLVAIVATGIALRISGFTLSGIWYDESLTFEAARLPFASMLEATKFTFAPPLWGVIVWMSVRIFGQNELALRLPALAASIFTLWLVYKLTDDFYLNHNQKIFVMIFVSLVPYQFWTAQDGRPYAIMSALYLGAAWFALRNCWLGFTACAGLLMYIHYASPFYMLGIYGIAAINNGFDLKHFRKVFFSGVIVLLSFSFWVPVYLATLKGDFTVPPFSVFYLIFMFFSLIFADTLAGQSALALFAYGAIIASLLFAIIFSAFLLCRLIKSDRIGQSPSQPSEFVRYLQLIILAFLPLTAMIIWGLLWKGFVYYRLLVAMMIPMFIWMVYTLTKTQFAGLVKHILVPIWITLLCVGIVNWSPISKSGDMRAVIDLVNHQWQKGDVIYHITGTSYMPFLQYFRDKPEYLLDEKLHDWLLPSQLIQIFGLEQKPLDAIRFKRAWIFYSRDNYITAHANQRAQAYIKNGTLIGIVRAWQFSDIEIYLVSMPIGQ